MSAGRDGLRETLEAIEKLEKEHRLSGARFSIRKGARIDAYSGAFFILETTNLMVDLLGRIDRLPKVEYKGPD